MSRLRECRKFRTALRRGSCVSGIRDSDGILLSILAAPLLPNRERIFRAFTYLPEKICTFRPESSSTLVYARARIALFGGPARRKRVILLCNAPGYYVLQYRLSRMNFHASRDFDFETEEIQIAHSVSPLSLSLFFQS